METDRHPKKKKKNKITRAIDKLEQSKFGMYRGPIKIGRGPTDQLLVVNCTDVLLISSSGLGVLAAAVTFNPNVTTEYSSYAARFNEYRVMAVECIFEPRHIVNTTGVISGTIIVAQDKSGATGTPTSYAQVWALANPLVKNVMGNKAFRYVIRADDYTDLDVGGTASPSSEFKMLYYADGLTVSTDYMLITRRWVVQFSSRK